MKNLNIISFVFIALIFTSCGDSAKKENTTVIENADNQNPLEKDWREEYAYTLGVQAYIYAFPLIYMSELRYDWSNVPESSFYSGLNQFHHKKVLSNHINFTSGGSPNQDTFYSFGWVDLRDGPVILSHPEMGERYFTFEIADYFSDNFAYVGKRTTGGKAGAFAIVPPHWKGDLPDNVSDSFESPTVFALVFGRTLVTGESDVLAVNELQLQYKMTPLSYWGNDSAAPIRRDVFEPYNTDTDPLAAWRTINRAWAENPLPVDRDRDLVKLFAEIGVGPTFSAESLDDLPAPIKRGLERAAAVTRPMLDEMKVVNCYKSKLVNRWNYPPKSYGRAGLASDFMTRAVNQSLGGILANDPEEAVYLNTSFDQNDKQFAGGHRYKLQIDGNNLPDAKEFWSITINGTADQNFIANDIMRYAIGDRTPGLVRDSDGSITIYIQPEEPIEAAERANWLPSPEDGNFYLVMRIYGPEQSILDQTWVPPTMTLIE